MTRDDVEIERSLYLSYPSVQDLSVDEDLSISNQLLTALIIKLSVLCKIYWFLKATNEYKNQEVFIDRSNDV